MSPPNAIVLAVDRLSAGYLGPYGNTWVDTPAMNRLASQSTLFETMISDSPSLSEVYQAYWRGTHALFPEAAGDPASLPQQLDAAGIPTVLVTDDAELDGQATAAEFSDRIVIDTTMPDQPALDVAQTRFAHLFATAVQWLREARPPFLLWLHARAMDRVWDAPMPLRAAFADVEDPLPSATVVPPDRVLEQDFDPDELLGFQHAYAGQLSVLDLCLRALTDAIDERLAGQPTLLVVTSPRGFPLGEHGRIGASGDQLYSEVLQVPCLLRHPNPATHARRCQTLVQPPDLYSTLLDWFGAAPADSHPLRRSVLPLLSAQPGWTRQLVGAAGAGQLAIRTPAWFLVRHPDGPPALYVKPDDRWEVNEVADRCQQIANQLSDVLLQISSAKHIAHLPELPDELVSVS